MNKTEYGNTGCIQDHGESGVDQSLLQAEISFWQEMIKFRDASMSDDCLERMQQALALAETKLNHSVTNPDTSHKPQPTQSSNVYWLKNRQN